MKMRKLSFLLFAFWQVCLFAGNYEVLSPDGKLKVALMVSDVLGMEVSYDGQQLFGALNIGLCLQQKPFKPVVSSVKHSSANETITPVVPFKFSAVKNHYNALRLNLKGGLAVEFRAYDDGMAYRFITNGRGGKALVYNETADFYMPEESMLHMQQPETFKTPYEEPYSHVALKDWNDSSKFALLPLLVDTKKGFKLLFSESDLHDYPCMFLKANLGKGVSALFPKYPLETKSISDRSINVVREADYIASTQAKRTYPWRYVVVASKDGDLVENTFTCRLSTQTTMEDTSWIRPGQVSWEWWHHTSPYHVDFVVGRNQETYKYYIDFASSCHIPYVLYDEGWAKSTTNPYEAIDALNIHELIAYGKEKNVGILLWLPWTTVEKNFDLFKEYEKWGVAGIKIDFMDHSDQWMVNYYERVAEEAAKHHLLIDFHGSFKPAGLEYKYPNVLSYEGVLGMEQGEFCNPANSLYHPFMRNAVGPMDYTPGAMLSMQPEYFVRHYPNNASVGTRAYQMALYVTFESGIQMLSDNPTFYLRDKDCTDFMTSVPVTWDETKVLAASVGEYLVVAKRKGAQWFIGGITAEKGHEIEISLDFLDNNRFYQMTMFTDGLNAGLQALDYSKESKTVSKAQVLKVKMVRNGGFAAVLK